MLPNVPISNLEYSRLMLGGSSEALGSDIRVTFAPVSSGRNHNLKPKSPTVLRLRIERQCFQAEERKTD